MMLRVIHLLGFPLGVNGPLQRSLYEAIHVAEKGVEVDFLVSAHTIQGEVLSKSIPEKYQDSLNVYSLKPMLPSGAVGWRVNNFIPLLSEAYRFLKARDDSVLHIHAPSPVSRPLTGSLIRKFLHGPTVVDLHDPWSGHPFSLSPIMLLQTHIMRFVINNADLIITPHRPLFKLIGSISNRKPIHLIPNGIDTEIFRPQLRTAELMKTLNFSFDDVVIAFSGQIMEEKGLDTLVQAAKIITNRFREAKFVIIGDGPLRTRIEELTVECGVQENFRFTGFLSVDKLIEYLSLADICVCPYKPMSHYNVMKIETPMKVVQYMALEKPVIMSRVSKENVVSWSNGGLLVDPGDPESLAEGISRLIEDEKLRQTMGRKAREYVQAKLGWSLIASKLVNLYKSL